MNGVPVQETARCIRAEYQELPGLSLTGSQVRRLYGLDGVTCEAVLAALVDVQFLARTNDGRYVRHDRHPAAEPSTRQRRPPAPGRWREPPLVTGDSPREQPGATAPW
jgi:hypothetical protein